MATLKFNIFLVFLKIQSQQSVTSKGIKAGIKLCLSQSHDLISHLFFLTRTTLFIKIKITMAVINCVLNATKCHFKQSSNDCIQVFFKHTNYVTNHKIPLQVITSLNRINISNRILSSRHISLATRYAVRIHFFTSCWFFLFLCVPVPPSSSNCLFLFFYVFLILVLSPVQITIFSCFLQIQSQQSVTCKGIKVGIQLCLSQSHD